uniref:Uncharacterized protein n=1 Tax=Xiphophorus maculatus TaxID=8083 RepID=A0A3B5QVE3_XIPMA
TVLGTISVSTAAENELCGAGPVECCFQICKTPIDGREIASFHVTDPLSGLENLRFTRMELKEQWVKMIINFLEKKHREN